MGSLAQPFVKAISKHHLGLLPSPCTAVFDLLSCKLHRLLGPCFKTGREWHCCTKLHCLQHYTLSGGPTIRLGHHQSGATTTRPSAPPWPGAGTGMSADTPGTSRVILRRQASRRPLSKLRTETTMPRGFHHTLCTPFGISQASGPVKLIATTLLPRLRPTLES